MPGDPQREQTIFTSHESLLLSSAQMLDEVEAEKDRNRQVRDREFKVLATVHGVQSLLLIREDNETCDLWGFERPEGFAAWTRRVLRDFQGLGEMLKTGPLSAVQAAGVARGLVVLTDGQRQLLAGMDGNMTMKSIRKAGRELARHLGEGLQAARNGPGNTIALLREPAGSARHPCGSFTVSTLGKVSVSAMPPTFPRVFMEVIGKVIITAFNSARELDNPLTEFAADFATVEIRAQDAGGGAIVFIAPREY
jgi:hypothetical protein